MPIIKMIPEFLFLDGICNKFPFVVVGHRTHEAYFFTFDIFRPEVFWYLSLVSLNDFVGCRYDTLCTPVILFQFHHFYIFVVFLKLENIFYRGSPETVNTLGIIAYHTYILVNRSQ